MIDKEKLVTSKDCTLCRHEKVCRHREDYLGFVNAIDEFSERYSGDKIAEGVAAVLVKCNYYEQPIPVPRSNKEDIKNA